MSDSLQIFEKLHYFSFSIEENTLDGRRPHPTIRFFEAQVVDVTLWCNRDRLRAGTRRKSMDLPQFHEFVLIPPNFSILPVISLMPGVYT